jgi:hypothetical protein
MRLGHEVQVGLEAVRRLVLEVISRAKEYAGRQIEHINPFVASDEQGPP